RYNCLVIYEVAAEGTLRLISELKLEGRPVSLAAHDSRFIVLERPAGDQKHVEPGWWEVFDRDGNRIGRRQLAGFYPDDLAVSPDGEFLYVLSSGRAEGDEDKPLPALEVFAVDSGWNGVHPVGRIAFDAADDPERLTLAVSGRYAAVFLAKSKH